MTLDVMFVCIIGCLVMFAIILQLMCYINYLFGALMCQLVLSLTMELDGSDEKDKATLDALLTSLITGLLQLGARDANLTLMSTRCGQHEVKLVVLRLLSVLMSRTRSPSKSATEVDIFGHTFRSHLFAQVFLAGYS